MDGGLWTVDDGEKSQNSRAVMQSIKGDPGDGYWESLRLQKLRDRLTFLIIPQLLLNILYERYGMLKQVQHDGLFSLPSSVITFALLPSSYSLNSFGLRDSSHSQIFKFSNQYPYLCYL